MTLTHKELMSTQYASKGRGDRFPAASFDRDVGDAGYRDVLAPVLGTDPLGPEL